MLPFKSTSVPDQIAWHLRTEILESRLSGAMPGVLRLAEELGVHQTSVVKALRKLERQGFLVSQGKGRRRLVRIPEDTKAEGRLRVGILLHEPQDKQLPYMIDLKHRLHQAGHSMHYAQKSLVEVGMDEHRLKGLVRATEADAWMILAGPRNVIRWFVQQPLPAFAIFGDMLRSPIAGSGPNKKPAFLAVTRRLLALGHRRIVYLTESPLAYNDPGPLIGGFLEQLEAAGIATGSYNLPEWEKTPAGLRRCLDALFAATPPTALVIDGVTIFAAVQQQLSRRGIHAPEQISLVCTDPDRSFDWCEPAIAHMSWEMELVIRRAARWADKVARGNHDRRKALVNARFIEGGTIGPAPRTGRHPRTHGRSARSAR